MRISKRYQGFAAMAAVLGLALAGCSSTPAAVGAPPAAPQLQLGAVATAGASTAGAAPGSCNPNAVSLAPTAGDSNGTTLQHIRKRGRLIVGVAQDGYLTGFLDPSTHQEAGFDVDIAEQVAEAIFNVPQSQVQNYIKFVAVTNPQRITEVQSGAIDMTVDTMTITCERLRSVAFSSVYYEAYQRVLVLADSGITSMKQLAGQKVCAADGSTSIATIENSPDHPVAYGVLDFSDCLVALQQNQITAVSTDDTILAGLAQQDPNLEVIPGLTLESEPYGIAVSKNAPDLERFVNGVLANIRANGTWEKIYNTWLGPYLGPAQPPPAQYSD
jgi:polar amino acid transport system substrate-binding protein